MVNRGGGGDPAGGAGPRGAELVYIAAVRQDGVKAEGKRAGQRAVHGGVTRECAAAASAAAKFGGGNGIAAATVSSVFEDHHGDRAGDAGSPIKPALDGRDGQAPLVGRISGTT